MLYLGYILLITMAAAAAGRGASRSRLSLTAKSETLLLRWMVLLFFLSYFILGLYKIEAMQVGNWDFGIYDSMLRNAASGNGLMLDYRGRFDHFSPIMMLFAPLYLLRDSPIWLPLIQSAALAFAAPLLYRTAKRYFRTGPVPLLLTAMYLFNPYYSRLALYDFHAECLFPLFLFAAFYCYSRKRMPYFFLFLALSPLIKEDFVIPVAAAGLWLMTQKRKRLWGAAAIAAAAFWTLFVLKIYYPLLLGENYWHYGRYALLAPTFTQTLMNIFGMIAGLWNPFVPGVVVSVLVPFAFLPAANWKMCLLFWLPTLGIQLVSTSIHQQLLFSHYSSALIAVTPVVALWGARTLRVLLRRRKPSLRQQRAGIASAAILMLAVHLFFCDLPLTRYTNYTVEPEFTYSGGVLSLPLRPAYWQEMIRLLLHADEVRAVTDLLPYPPGTTMICQNEVGPAFLHRGTVTVYDFPELGIGLTRPDRVDYFILDRGNYHNNGDLTAVNRLLSQLAEDPEYRVINHPSGLLIFARRKLFPEEAPGSPASFLR